MKNVGLEFDEDANEIFVLVEGQRGRPGTPEAGTWIPLLPGYVVTSNDDDSEITIEHDWRRLH